MSLIPTLLIGFTYLFVKLFGAPLQQKWRSIRAGKLEGKQIDYLNWYSPYYRKLKPKHQKEFKKRVAIFIDSKEFIPRQMEYVTEEMKIVVACLAIQLTFGLPQIYLAHFRKILIYPDNYYSTVNHNYHKGEVNPRFGIIVLSWKNLVEGIINETDGINLGLHELAHAIHLENRIANKEFGFMDVTLWKKYLDLAEFEIFKIKSAEPSFFRSAAAIDLHEFFAVLIENFFEKPKALKAYSPSLYNKVTLLLQQDPIKLLSL